MSNPIHTKIALIFTVCGDGFRAEELSQAIGILPNRKRKPEIFSYQIGYENTLFIEDLTNKFLALFMPKINELLAYLDNRRLQTRVDIVIYQNGDETTPSLFFDEEFVQLAAKLNASVDIDLYR